MEMEDWVAWSGSGVTCFGRELKLEIDSKGSVEREEEEWDLTMRRGADDIPSFHQPLSVEIDYNSLSSSFCLSLVPVDWINIRPCQDSSRFDVKSKWHIAGLLSERSETFLFYYLPLESLISISCQWCPIPFLDGSQPFETSKLDRSRARGRGNNFQLKAF